MLPSLQDFAFQRSKVLARPLPPIADRFGIRSFAQVRRDLAEVLRDGLTGARFQVDVGSAGLIRPDLAFAAYAGLVPRDGRAPIFNLFDRSCGGRRFTQRVSRSSVRDFRGGRLSYDEHDGTDFVCPVGTPLVAAAPGTVVMVRDRWLRGGLTITIDHGDGSSTQYTHCARALAPLGTVVQRGDPIALSGSAGLDMVQFFPWVPPHVHFMVYVDGRPVDPYLARGESKRAGVWLTNDVQPSGPLPSDPSAPKTSDIDEKALIQAIETCTDARIREEIAACNGVAAYIAAIMDDAFVHDAWAWPKEGRPTSVRPQRSLERETLPVTLPLPKEGYVGARFADAPWTAPSEASQ